MKLTPLVDDSNCRFVPILIILSLFLPCLVLPSGARGEPGQGINIGSNISLKPALVLDFSYDTNVSRSADAAVKSAALGANPLFNAYYNHEKAKFQISYEHFLRQFLSPSARSYSYYDDFLGKLAGDILPKNLLGLSVTDTLSSRSYGHRSEEVNDFYGLLKRSFNDFAVAGHFRPGEALEVNLGVHWLLNLENFASRLYSDQVVLGDGQSYQRAFKNEFGTQLRGKWRFFPKTMLLSEINYAHGQWNNTPECTDVTLTAEECTGEQLDDGTYVGSSSNRVLRKSPIDDQWSFLSGIAGQFTNTIQANAFVGYGGLYNTDDPDNVSENAGGWKGFLVQLQTTYSPMETHHVSLGFNRRFADSSVHDYLIVNALSLSYAGLYASRLQLVARVELDFRENNSTEVEAEFATRTDRVLSSKLQGDYRVTRWLSASASIEPQFTFSVPNDDSGKDAEWLKDNYSYQKFVFTVGLRGTY